MKFCPNCGNQIGNGVKFCPACGTNIAAYEADHPAVPADMNREASENTQDDLVTNTEQSTEPEVPKQPTQMASAQTQQSSQSEREQGFTSTQQATFNTGDAASQNQPQLGFVGSVQYILQHVFEFNGDAPESRKAIFWWGYLGYCIAAFVVAFIPLIGVILVYAGQVLLVSAAMRRLSYIGQNTGLAWLILIPLVGLYTYFLMLLDRKAV